MPFCSHCGAQNRDGARFCESCGQPIGETAPGAAPPSPAQQQVRNAISITSGTPKTLLLVGIGLYALGAVLVLLGGDILGLLLCGAIGAGAYFAAYLPLGQGDYPKAAKGALYAGMAALIIGFLTLLFTDQWLASIWHFLAAAAFGVAATGIKKLS